MSTPVGVGATPAELVDQADALLESVDPAKVDPDLASLLADYRTRKDAGNPALWIVARAVVRCADRVGVELPAVGADGAGGTGGPKAIGEMTAAELKAEVERRNEGRDEDARIVPDGTKKADLLTALVADDAAE